MLTLISRVNRQFLPQFQTFLDNWGIMKNAGEAFDFDLKSMVKIDGETGNVFLMVPENYPEIAAKDAAKAVILIIGVAQLAFSCEKPKRGSPSLN